MRSSSVFVILQHTSNFAKMPPVKRFLTIFIATLFLAVFVPAQVVEDVARSIRTALDDGNYLAAINTLEDFKKTDPRVFEYNNFDYLLGRLAQKTGDHAKAMAAFEAVDSRASGLSSYPLWHLAAIARDTGNLPLERIYLQKILIEPESILFFAASNRIARSYFESRDFPQAIRLLKNLLVPPEILPRIFQPSSSGLISAKTLHFSGRLSPEMDNPMKQAQFLHA